MLLERLSIENYGVYAGRTEFDLAVTPKKPIILVGGFNGAGKTTIFESLMIALYGKTYLGRRISKKEYSEFITDKMHRHEGIRADSASIEVAFRFYHNGCDDGYVVNRSWIKEGASVEEILSIQKNDEPMNDVDESQWQSFIEGLIPLGIARLFFFDGEKIVRMTEWDNPNNEEVKSSLDMLLGSELVNRLHSDLDLYMMRRSGKTNGEDNAIQKKYEDLRHEKDTLSSEVEMLNAESEKKTAEIQDIFSKIESKESKLKGIGIGYTDIRGDLLTQKAVLEEKIRHLNKTIQEKLNEDAPLYIIPDILGRIQKRLKSDMAIASKKMSAHMIKDRIAKLKDEVSDGFWPVGISDKQISDIIMKFEDMFKEPNNNAFFDVAPNDASWMLQKISRIRNECKPLQKIIKEYDGAMAHFEKTESNLARIPKDDEVGPQITEINSLHQEIGILKSEVSHIAQQVSAKQAYQKILQNKLKGLIDSIHKSEVADAGMLLASKMQNVLDTYFANLKERKIRELESNLLDATRQLLHKKYIHRIEIDRKTLEIRVYENGDDENPGHLKSMGERQIIGTALLWAIARTSGRSLPFVIDTPLGRLDGKHLSNLTDKFYPFASHQIILLSTDREIGVKEYAKLSKYTSKSYKITCDESKSITTVDGGYFMEDEIAPA